MYKLGILLRYLIIITVILALGYAVMQYFQKKQTASSSELATSEVQESPPAQTPSTPSESPANVPITQADIAGTWEYILSTGDKDIKGTLTLSGPADALQGTMTNVTSEASADQLHNVVYNSPNLTFELQGSDVGTVTFGLQKDGDFLTGEMKSENLAPIPITALRK